MAHKEIFLALSVIMAAAPAAASQPEADRATAAPAGGPETKYCMRIERITGSRIEQVRCWTREEWAEQGVDVDQDWAKEGVEVRS